MNTGKSRKDSECWGPATQFGRGTTLPHSLVRYTNPCEGSLSRPGKIKSISLEGPESNQFCQCSKLAEAAPIAMAPPHFSERVQTQVSGGLLSHWDDPDQCPIRYKTAKAHHANRHPHPMHHPRHPFSGTLISQSEAMWVF